MTRKRNPDVALTDLVNEAIAVLRDEMAHAELSKDRIAAANSVLDRAGYGRATKVMTERADQEILKALEAALGARRALDAPVIQGEVVEPLW